MKRKAKEQWYKETLNPSLSRGPQRKDRFETDSGIEILPLYTPEDAHGDDYADGSGYPGEYPYTRGIQPSMYRGRLWTMRQYSGFASAEDSNQRYRYLLEQGQTGLSIAFDLPTQMGYNSDHPLAKGEVGKVGVPIDTLRDMEVLLKGIPLERVSTSMTINSTASILLALYIAVAKKQGISPAKLDGTIQNDILKEYIARGTYIYPPGPSMRLITDVFSYCAREVPRWNAISISGYHMREAGATAVQELAFTFANAISYVQAALDAGLDVDDFAGSLSFFFVAQNNLLEEVAKFRAARRMWAYIMRHRFHAKKPRSWILRFHVQTAGVTLTAQQPDNNVVRTTMQALSAILGGAQSLHVNSKDEALSLPSEDAVQLSLRTQQVLAHESGIADTADPLGGSYYVEHLTNELERQALAYLSKIDEMGGGLEAISFGYQVQEIQEAAFKYQREIEANQRVVVGVNQFTTEDPPTRGILRVDPAQERHQVQEFHRVLEQRDNEVVQKTLTHLKEVAEGEKNTMPAILECVEAYASVGEISDTFRSLFGEQEHSAVI
ncbi:MAG: methylmalonyl-CoA mutase [SAR202 cluster bacterium Io17-Chloro-G3]|nr:MAG: methylmalonyl-CoA mutase [SAR202 cluster bacterium Io17-Chloro-G3]